MAVEAGGDQERYSGYGSQTQAEAAKLRAGFGEP